MDYFKGQRSEKDREKKFKTMTFFLSPIHHLLNSKPLTKKISHAHNSLKKIIFEQTIPPKSPHTYRELYNKVFELLVVLLVSLFVM